MHTRLKTKLKRWS